MSVPLATIFHGDVTLEQGAETSQFGWGDLSVNRQCIIRGTENSSGGTTGSLSVYGGMSVNMSAYINQNLNVLNGITSLTETFIYTDQGSFTVTGGNMFNLDVINPSNLKSSGDLNVESKQGVLYLYSGKDSAGAIKIESYNGNGGIALNSGSGGIIGTALNGNIVLTADNGRGTIKVNSSFNNQNLNIQLSGDTNSQLLVESSGNNSSLTALLINTTNNSGNIIISNKGGLGNGKINQLTGSGGYKLVTNTGGNSEITIQGAQSLFQVNSSTTNNHMIFSLNNKTDSSLLIRSEGTNVTNPAIKIETLNTAGNINIIQPVNSTGQIYFYPGSGGYVVDTQAGGSSKITTNGATSLYTNATTADNQDLTVSVTGNTNSKVNIKSEGNSYNAINIQSTGGIYAKSNGVVSVQSLNEIDIGTENNIPVKIGTSTSTTTIQGNLIVKGVTTTVESEVMTVEDNIITVNNAPVGTSDGGIAIKRYQSANNNGTGEVVSDIPEETGYFSDGSSSLMLVLGNTASNEIGHYNGWWIKITSGPGSNQVRRIKDYTINNGNKIAYIYSTDDQTTILDNPSPIEGLDISSLPDTTSMYSLHPCAYVMNIWDESQNEFAFVCSNSIAEAESQISHYSNLHINDLLANAVTTTLINNSLADMTRYVNMTNNSTTPVEILNFPSKYGVYILFVKPNDDLESNRTHGIFMIGRVNSVSAPGTIVRIISAKGVYGDQLDIQWPPDSNPYVFYRPYPNGLGSTVTQFKIKVVSL